MEDAARLAVAGSTYVTVLQGKDHHAHMAALAAAVGESNWDTMLSLMAESPVITEADLPLKQWRLRVLECVERLRNDTYPAMETTLAQAWQGQKKLQRVRSKLRALHLEYLDSSSYEFPATAEAPLAPKLATVAESDEEDAMPVRSGARGTKRRLADGIQPPAKRVATEASAEKEVVIDIVSQARMPAFRLVIQARTLGAKPAIRS
jgi:hypothetical protein